MLMYVVSTQNSTGRVTIPGSSSSVMGWHRMEWDAVMGMQIESQYRGSAPKPEAAADRAGRSPVPPGPVKLDLV